MNLIEWWGSVEDRRRNAYLKYAIAAWLGWYYVGMKGYTMWWGEFTTFGLFVAVWYYAFTLSAYRAAESV